MAALQNDLLLFDNCKKMMIALVYQTLFGVRFTMHWIRMAGMKNVFLFYLYLLFFLRNI